MKSREFSLITKIIKNHFDHQKKLHDQSNLKEVPLAFPPYDWKEVCDALKSMLDLKTTMGEKVQQFEKSFPIYYKVYFRRKSPEIK